MRPVAARGSRHARRNVAVNAMTELAYVNGAFSPLADAKVSVEDRGFQFGDGVYEVLVAYDRRLFLPQAHYQRLRRSAVAIGLEFDFNRCLFDSIIHEGLERSELQDALVYIQLTRGAAARSLVIPPGVQPTLVVTFRPLPVIPADYRRRGARVMTTRDSRWTNCYIKAITLLPNVLARNEALRQGFDDAIFVSPDGSVRECTAANLLFVCNGGIVVPPRDGSILHGVTQDFVMECTTAIGLQIGERRVDVATLQGADEVLMCSTTVEVLGITSIDGVAVGDGRVGPTTQRLFDEFRLRSRRR